MCASEQVEWLVLVFGSWKQQITCFGFLKVDEKAYRISVNLRFKFTEHKQETRVSKSSEVKHDHFNGIQWSRMRARIYLYFRKCACTLAPWNHKSVVQWPVRIRHSPVLTCYWAALTHEWAWIQSRTTGNAAKFVTLKVFLLLFAVMWTEYHVHKSVAGVEVDRKCLLRH